MEEGLKVIICDDSALIRKKLKATLQKCHCSLIIEAESGDIALKLAKTENPDLIFLDIVMPDKNGLDTLSEINKENANIKVVMVSSAGTKSNLKKALERGAYDFIQKPISLETVTNVIEKAMKAESEKSANV